LLDPLTGNFSNNPPMLLRLAVLHSIGHHLDVPDSFPKAVAAFDKLLALTPEDPQAYPKRAPSDARTAALLDAIRHDRLQVR
jgi:hypothetical protein